jgi:UDP-GlcNAc3NAcA epimerase
MSHYKLLSILGARPQIIKASAISRAIRKSFGNTFRDIILHTGQHYDRDMSDIFFKELEIHQPDYNLGVGSGSHGKQTALMISGIEEVLMKENPHCVLLYGDTNSTLAGAVAASKLHFPVIHIEAGLRSFNKRMPEEINRIVSDHSSTLLFAPTNSAFHNLMNEGFKPENSPPYSIDNPKIYLTGDIMYDNALYYGDLSDRKMNFLPGKLGVDPGNYVLVTIHRDLNTDDLERLTAIITALKSIASKYSVPMVMPFHPRTTKILTGKAEGLYKSLISDDLIRIIPPVSYLEMIFLEKNSRIIITDSGGLQKESHFFKKPCLVLRHETEWTELVNNGTATLTDADPEKIEEAFNKYINTGADEHNYPAFYGDGKASEFILTELEHLLGQSQK